MVIGHKTLTFPNKQTRQSLQKFKKTAFDALNHHIQPNQTATYDVIIIYMFMHITTLYDHKCYLSQSIYLNFFFK